MLHPVYVIPIFEVISGMRTSGFFPIFGSEHSHLCLDHEVLKFHGLNQVRVPDVAAIADTEVTHNLRIVVQRVASFFQVVLSSEHCSILLHCLLHAKSNL